MQRSFGIDFIRTVSILLVILRHYRFTTGFNYGYFAIEFLFVISGFLIGQILFTDFFSTEVIQQESLKRFMTRRWFRILPLYYFCLFVKFAIDHSIGWNILYYVFFMQNHFYGITFYPETWTLVIDEWFYLGVPLMLFLFIKYVSAKPSKILWFIIGVILTINVLRFLWVYFTNAQWAGLVGNVPFRQDTLLFGVLLAFVKNKYRHVFDWMNSFKFFLFTLVMLSGYFAVIYFIRTPVDRVNSFIWTRTISFSLLSFLIMLTLPFFENSFPRPKSPRLKFYTKAITWGSKLSYAIYLVHVEVLLLLLDKLTFPGIHMFWTRCMIVVVTLVISYILYNIIEKPLLIYRDKYFPDRKPSPAP
jgi:peptidoglycan/LPS O-acetylase OafA/YrhL